MEAGLLGLFKAITRVEIGLLSKGNMKEQVDRK